MRLQDLIKEENKDNSSIIVVNNPSPEFSAVFGGTPSTTYGASYMKKKVSNYLSGKNVIYCDWEVGFNGALDLIKQKNPKGIITDVYGFSKGGRVAFPAINEPTVRFVGLMDPSIEGDYAKVKNIPSGKQVLMVYLKNRGWGVNTLQYAIDILGNRAIGLKNKGHSEFTTILFDYKGKPTVNSHEKGNGSRFFSLDDVNW